MIRRLVSIDFWTDDKVVDRFSPEDKYFMLYLLTNPHTTQLGIYKLNIKYAAFETGYSVEVIRSLLDRFENHLGVIYYSAETGEIAIKNYLIHSIIKGGKPVADLLWKEINDVKNKELIVKVFEHIKDSDKINKTVRNIINTYTLMLNNSNNNNIYNNINHNENHNENENDKSYPLSYHDSLDESSDDKNNSCTSATHTPSQGNNNQVNNKVLYGLYNHVLLSDKEFNELNNLYGSEMTSKAIKHLDEYIESKNYQDNNHFLCIKRWVISAVKEREYKENKLKGSQQKPKNQQQVGMKRNYTEQQFADMERQLLESNRKEIS